jgi:hypothetical protein
LFHEQIFFISISTFMTDSCDFLFRPGSVQTSAQLAFVKQFYEVHRNQSCIFPPPQPLRALKSLQDSMEDELLSPPLHLARHSERFFLLTKEDLPNAVRLSALILRYLSPQVGKIGLSLALGRLTPSKVRIDRSVSLCTLLNTSLENDGSTDFSKSPIKDFLKNNKVQPNSTGALVCEAPTDTLNYFKTNANAGKWKTWFSLPPSRPATAAADTLTEEPLSTGPELVPGELRDEDYDQQHIDFQILLAPFVPGLDKGTTGDSAYMTPVRNRPKDTSLADTEIPSPMQTDVDGNGGDITTTFAKTSPDLVTLMACHGSLLLDWFDTRADALFSPALLEALRSAKFGDYGPYFFSRRGVIHAVDTLQLSRKSSQKNSSKSSPHRVNALDLVDQGGGLTEEEENVSALDDILREHLSK